MERKILRSKEKKGVEGLIRVDYFIQAKKET